MEQSLDLTEQALAEDSFREGETMDKQDPGVNGCVSVRRWTRERSVRETSLELIHPNKYALLHDVWDTSSGLVMQGLIIYTSWQGNYCSSNGWK